MTDQPLTLYTIGHSSLSAADFLAHLRQNDITVLVDVRSAPYSRFVPHFNKAKLETYLKENGLDYRYAGEYLGGRPKDAEVNQPEGEPNQRPDYVAVMKTESYQKGISRLLQIVAETQATGGNAAVMCSEGDPLNCHRHHLIARSLLDPAVKVIEQSVQVVHILKDGTAEPVEVQVFETDLTPFNQPRLF